MGKFNSDELSMMFVSLADQGVDMIEIGYDGGGDSGEIEEVFYLDSKGKGIKGILREDDVTDTIRNLCYDKIMNDIEGDWINNEGGYGRIYINVPSGEYKIDSHIRITETVDNQYEGTIHEKLEED